MPRGWNSLSVMGATSPEIWFFVCRGDGQFPQFFRTLLALYAHKVTLKMYRYRDSIQVQIHVMDDEVFYGWKLHCCRGLIPLFRGMVVQYDPIHPTGSLQSVSDANNFLSPVARDLTLDYLAHIGIASPTLVRKPSRKATAVSCGERQDEIRTIARIVGVAKLKCLKYIVRTFGIRKHVSSLIKDGNIEVYLRRSVPTFFRNWSVPESHRPRLSRMLKEWANHVTLLGVQDKERLQINYLKFLEPFLDKFEQREQGTGTSNDAIESQGSTKLRDYFLVILNFSRSGEHLPAYLQDALESGGLSKLGSSSVPVRSGFVLFDKPPKTSFLRSEEPTLVIIVPPVESSDDGKASTCWKMYQAAQRTLEAVPEIPKIEVQSESEWFVQLKALPVAPVKERQVRLVLAVAGLPPGGGKSTFFQTTMSALGDCCQVVSSDIELGAFDEVLVGALKRKKIVCYDKNIPNAEGIQKMAKVLGKMLRDFDIKVVLVVPEQLGDAEKNHCWERVKSRSAEHPALTIHGEGGEAKARDIFTNIFFNACANFVPELHRSGAAISTSVFWDGEDAVREFVAHQNWDKFPEMPVPGVMDLFDMPFSEPSQKLGISWASIEIFGTSLHVTLVPPVFDPKDREGNNRRKTALDALRHFCDERVKVTLVAYHQAVKASGADVDRIACWEVGEVCLPEEAHLPEQRCIYHVTDLAAMSYGRKPKAAAELMAVLRSVPREDSDLCGEVGKGLWDLRSWHLANGGFVVDGVVKIHE